MILLIGVIIADVGSSFIVLTRVNWMKIVVGSGDIITASGIKNPDAFLGALCSFGSLGITTLSNTAARASCRAKSRIDVFSNFNGHRQGCAGTTAVASIIIKAGPR